MTPASDADRGRIAGGKLRVMKEPLWADVDEDWRAKEERALEQRRANEEAERLGLPQPYVNAFWLLDPTKVGPDATPEEITLRYREFSKICRPPQPKKYTI